jgi:branched-chain amino acid transport system ATP-binding protein
MPEPLLDVRALDAFYGDFQALFGVSLRVAPGEVVAVIGANGAGKSTLLNCIAGAIRSRRDAILFDGEQIGHQAAHAVVGRGIALVPEGRRLFASLSVEENLLIGGQVGREGPWNLARIYDLFPVLAERRQVPSTSLSGGQQQMVAIGRALMPEPRLVIFDELSLGLAPKVIDEIFEVIPQILDWGVAVMLIEQNVHRSLEIADRAYVIERGEVVLSGRPEDLDDVQQAYFGARASTLTTGGDG